MGSNPIPSARYPLLADFRNGPSDLFDINFDIYQAETMDATPSFGNE